jgi:heme/copper-type cytochrome/quinol oxidase subunit 3
VTAAVSARRGPFSDRHGRQAAAAQGMRLFLLSLGILFAATLIGYGVVRLELGPAAVEVPPLPGLLWLSTVLLLASSGSIQVALGAARSGRPDRLVAAMAATTLLGVAFLAVQSVSWLRWAGPLVAGLREQRQAFLVAAFYVLTGIHAAHVLGGLVPLAVVTRRAAARRYGPAEHGGVLHCAMYWHFLDAVWLALFGTLLLGTR